MQQGCKIKCDHNINIKLTYSSSQLRPLRSMILHSLAPNMINSPLPVIFLKIPKGLLILFDQGYNQTLQVIFPIIIKYSQIFTSPSEASKLESCSTLNNVE